MKIKKIKYTLVALLAGAALTACNTGTDPGDTNTERSGIERTEESDAGRTYNSADGESEDYERHYEGREGTARGDSGYVEGEKRETRGKHLKEGLKN